MRVLKSLPIFALLFWALPALGQMEALPTCTVGTLAQCAGTTPGNLAWVTDGATASDCGTGGGSVQHICTSDGDGTFSALSRMPLTMTEGEVIDMSGIDITVDDEGLLLPRAAIACLAATQDGQVCYDESTDLLYIGTGVYAKVVGGFCRDDTLGVVYPCYAPATDDLAVGGVNSSADFFVDAATGNVTSDGTATFASYDSPAHATDGGSVTLREPEGCTNCDAAGEGETLTVEVMDLTNSMSTDKVWSPGFTATFAVNAVDFDAEDDGGFCLSLPDAGTLLDCNGNNFKAKAGVGFVDGVAVNKAYVMLSTLASWDAAGGDDVMYLQMHVVDTTDDSESQFGDRFKIINGTTGCGTELNCADAAGTFEWSVNRVTDLCTAANTPYDCCTDEDVGADCPGVSTVVQGLLGVEIEADSNDVDGDADARLNVMFKAY